MGRRRYCGSTWATAATAGSAPTSRGRTCGAGWDSSRPGTVTSPGSRAFGRSTLSATPDRSPWSGRTPVWTGWSARRRRWRSSDPSSSTLPRRRRPGVRARGGRDRRPGGGQARALREAAGEHGRGGRGDGRGRGESRAAGRVAMVGFTYRRVPAVTLARQLVISGERRDPSDPGRVPAGLAQRRRGPADLASAEGLRGVGRAGRHRGAHRGRRPVRHRAGADPG